MRLLTEAQWLPDLSGGGEGCSRLSSNALFASPNSSPYPILSVASGPEQGAQVVDEPVLLVIIDHGAVNLDIRPLLAGGFDQAETSDFLAGLAEKDVGELNPPVDERLPRARARTPVFPPAGLFLPPRAGTRPRASKATTRTPSALMSGSTAVRGLLPRVHGPR